MPRPPTTDEERRRERRRIRDAAASLHRERGISAITARAIAERAGISTGKIYSYFGNLQELMRSLWAEPVAKLNQHLEAIAEQHPDPTERIEALAVAYLDFARANEAVYRGAFLFVRPTSLPPPDRRPPADVPLLRLLAEAIREGQASGTVRADDPDQLAEVIWAGLHGSIALPINADLYAIDDDRTLSRSMVDLLLAAVLTRQPEEASS